MTDRLHTPLTRIRLTNFTAFRELDFQPSSGINVLIGANGTGKTHLMKVAYAACHITKTENNFADKLVRVFLPSGRQIGRLARRQPGHAQCKVLINRGSTKIGVSFTGRTRVTRSAKVSGQKAWTDNPVDTIYIPVKEMLANAPGFRSLYAQREVHFEEIYADIVDRAYLPVHLGRPSTDRQPLIRTLREAMEGNVIIKGEEFFLDQNRQLEFTLLAEGIRKLGLLYLLIQNGSLSGGSILFWDEPETNLNPQLFKSVISILLELQRQGVQVFLATHDYVVLKELDLQAQPEDSIAYHSLYYHDREVLHNTTYEYLRITNNRIRDTFDDLYDRELDRALLSQTTVVDVEE